MFVSPFSKVKMAGLPNVGGLVARRTKRDCENHEADVMGIVIC